MTPFTTRAKRKAKVNGDSVSSKSRTYIYDLINVVVHKGEINSGHYISYCRDNGQVCI
jgi:ubiquitin carboxyl-terminal hydrolase 22/27/51